MTFRDSSPRAAWLTAALAVLALALVAARPAAAVPSACWQDVLEDWRTGAITRPHAVGCLREALRRMPEDVRLYSSAADDISRALASRVLSSRTTASARPTTAASLVPAQPGSEGWPASLALAGALGGLGLLATAGLALSRRRIGRRR